MQFTYDAYENLILLLKKHNYNFCNYSDYSKYDKSVIVRHDVDWDLEKALEFSEIERELGISSIYFVMVTSNFYNVFSRKSRELLRGIHENGHFIGLHFDETQYNQTDKDWWKRAIDYEISLLEQCVGREISDVSMHRISKETMEADWKIRDGKVVNCYKKEFIKDHKYVSDSRRNWKEDIIDLVENELYSRLHILVHPIWYYENEKSAKEVLYSFCEMQKYKYYDELDRRSIRDLSEILKKSELSDYGEGE